MEYKVGEKLICKKNGSIYPQDDMRPFLNEGCVYEITSIQDIGCGYYAISGHYFYSEKDKSVHESKMLNGILQGIPKGNVSGVVGTSGIAPSHKLSDYFYTKKESRKLKLDKINGKTNENNEIL